MPTFATSGLIAATVEVTGAQVRVTASDRTADIDGGAFAVRIGEVEGTLGLSSSGGQARIGHASPTSISAAAAATSISTAPTAASPPRQPAAPFGSAG